MHMHMSCACTRIEVKDICYDRFSFDGKQKGRDCREWCIDTTWIKPVVVRLLQGRDPSSIK